jgi:glycosyltransferase involved in cell wall biosynthesis
MKIVIDCRIAYINDVALGIFTSEFWQDMALLKPEHEFIFLAAGNPPPAGLVKNVLVCKLKKINIKWIDRKRLNKSLAAWQADRFITTQETGFCIHHFFHKKESAALPDQWILFADNVEAQPLQKTLPATVIGTVKPACRIVIAALSWAEAESIKTQYTGGRSFFLFTGNISGQHQLVELLKAFSAFKKWQQSNMQLVIAGYTTAWTQVLEEKLLTYKYRTDVVVLKNPATAEMAKLVAACYAMVYPAVENIFPLALFWAVQSNKAVIATDNQRNRQVIPAAEWVDKNNTAEGFAKAMIRLYKDEKHQQSLVQQTIEPAKQFNRGQMLAEVWQCIEK